MPSNHYTLWLYTVRVLACPPSAFVLKFDQGWVVVLSFAVRQHFSFNSSLQLNDRTVWHCRCSQLKLAVVARELYCLLIHCLESPTVLHAPQYSQ